jgi:hypothetical protein
MVSGTLVLSRPLYATHDPWSSPDEKGISREASSGYVMDRLPTIQRHTRDKVIQKRWNPVERHDPEFMHSQRAWLCKPLMLSLRLGLVPYQLH